MLQALLADLAGIDGIHLTVMQDARLVSRRAEPGQPDPEWIRIVPEHEFDVIWKAAMLNVDAVWPIAPETGGVLEKLCRDVRESGKILLNSPAEAIALTAAKLETLRHLKQHGINVVPTARLEDFQDQFPGPWVVKPNDGVGCQGTRLVRKKRQLHSLQATRRAKNLIIQPFLEGDSMSLSGLFKQGDVLLLSCNRQNIELRNDYFSLTGCTLDVVPAASGVFSNLARAIARAIPALFGYAGVDLVLVDGRPVVLEINPRLTTSYAGLSKAINRNVAAMVLDLLSPASRVPDRFRNQEFAIANQPGEVP